MLQLESDVKLLDDELIKKGLQLVIDGTAPSLVEDIYKAKLEKHLRDIQLKYEAALAGILAIQSGDNPIIVKERLDAIL